MCGGGGHAIARSYAHYHPVIRMLSPGHRASITRSYHTPLPDFPQLGRGCTISPCASIFGDMVTADSHPQTGENLLYYAADNSRLCVRRIVLALVKPGKFYCKGRRGGECAHGAHLLPWFLTGHSRASPETRQGIAPSFFCRATTRGKRRKNKK